MARALPRSCSVADTSLNHFAKRENSFGEGGGTRRMKGYTLFNKFSREIYCREFVNNFCWRRNAGREFIKLLRAR